MRRCRLALTFVAESERNERPRSRLELLALGELRTRFVVLLLIEESPPFLEESVGSILRVGRGREAEEASDDRRGNDGGLHRFPSEQQPPQALRRVRFRSQATWFRSSKEGVQALQALLQG